MKKILLLIAIAFITICSYAQCESLSFLKYSTTYSFAGITFYMQANVHSKDKEALFNWFLKDGFFEWNDIGNKCVHVGKKGHNGFDVTVILKQDFFTNKSDENQKADLFLAASDLSTVYLHKKTTIIAISPDKKYKAEASCDY
ncbi:MAG: hypothetical protein KGL19_07355 [Bacteroidota bacterium]|nr:hypothetical protein [Bacteroidota bacterium]